MHIDFFKSSKTNIWYEYNTQYIKLKIIPQRKMKTDTTIDLMKTTHGYSIIEEDILLNKPALNVNVQQPALPFTNAKYPRQQKHPQIIPKKFIPQQTFTIYPYINSKPAQNHPYLIIPSRSQWFNLNSVNQIERKALPEWFKQKKGLMATMNNMKFEKNQELYKKYRNYIIDLGKTKHINATISRKGLAGDACAIIRIHEFLEKWGLINFVHKKKAEIFQNINGNSTQQNSLHTEKSHQPLKRRDGFDRDKTLISKIYEKDDLELLRKITKCFRPVCTSCQSICGIAWYEYKDILVRKTFSMDEESSTSTVTSGEQFQYQLKVCFSCFVEKNYPVVLAVDDFTKKTLMEEFKQINFDQKYGKKKAQEWLRVAQAVEKNKFNIAKCAQVLKLEESEIIDILVQMPVQNLEKISRIQQQTEDENQNQKSHKKIQKDEHVNGNHKRNEDAILGDTDQDLRVFKANLQVLDCEEKKLYEQFLQGWLLKMYTKIGELEEWDKAIQWKMEENESIKKYNIAERLRKCVKIEE